MYKAVFTRKATWHAAESTHQAVGSHGSTCVIKSKNKTEVQATASQTLFRASIDYTVLVAASRRLPGSSNSESSREFWHSGIVRGFEG
jgi:hypothetical protein